MKHVSTLWIHNCINQNIKVLFNKLVACAQLESTQQENPVQSSLDHREETYIISKIIEAFVDSTIQKDIKIPMNSFDHFHKLICAQEGFKSVKERYFDRKFDDHSFKYAYAVFYSNKNDMLN